MTAPKALSASDRKALLEDLCGLKTDDDDAVQQDAKWFLPLDTHRRALRPETLVVRGGRGTGKSALFHFLGHLRRLHREGAVKRLPLGQAFEASTWIEGYGAAIDHPHLGVVGDFARSADDDRQRAFWFGWLCIQLSHGSGEALPPGALAGVAATAGRQHTPAALADAAIRQLAVLSSWMDGLERGLQRPVVVLYDGLDRIGSAFTERCSTTASLLRMWLSLADRYRRIRPKVFVREDLFQKSIDRFPDASKLDARSVSLDWRVEDLYRVLIKHMANLSPRLRDWVQSSARGAVPLEEQGPLGWMPPEPLPLFGRPSQKGFVDHMAGELMGSGAKKGFTYSWIPNRLQDAHSRVAPRSIMSLVRHASEHALQRGPSAVRLRLLHPEELQAALESTSKRRANELQEEFPVVARLENLRTKTVMLSRREAVSLLARAAATPDDHGSDGEAVLRALIDLGAASERPDGRIDIPDIYRYGFGILRRGGVKRPR